MLGALAVFQVLTPKLHYFSTSAGNLLSIFIKLVLGYLLIGLTGGIASSYYLILLVPVVSAATTLRLLGTALFLLLAALSYISFLLFLSPEQYVDPGGYREIALRVLFLLVVGYLTHELAARNREAARDYQQAAEQLQAANEHLQDAEAAVRRADRLAALGQLTAGLAHELRNPLGTMRVSAEMLSKQVGPENEVARELAGYIASEVDRVNSLITRFLDFARPLQIRRHPADISQVIDRSVAELRQHQPPLDVAVYKNLSPDVHPFLFDAELMERVVYNLLLNAAQATPPGGTVTVKTRLTPKGVELAVIDRGSGINAEQREHIFNPFFTTKSSGVGLGLAIVSKIVDEHGGVITVESEKGEGSVFRILLPTQAVHEETTAAG